MKNQLLWLGLLCLPLALSAQLYTNASANLPDDGAKGQSMDVRAADLDEDGDLDIILANEFQPNTILFNNGNGVFTKAQAGQLPAVVRDSEDVAIADFNGDGHLDLVFCSEDDVVLGGTNVHEYYFGDGLGNFTAAPYPLADSEANAVITADVNDDGHPDLLFGNNGPTAILINQGNGAFVAEPARATPLQRTTQDLALADLDGDGDLDLLEGNENGNAFLINDGNGFFHDSTAQRLPTGNLNRLETRKIATGDVDADGDIDVFWANVSFITGKLPQNRLLLNDGTGHFTDVTAAQLPTDSDHTIDAIFEDIDLDGDLDLVVANVFGGPIKIYGNDGSGHFTNTTTATLGQSYLRDALGVIAADLNGDGLRDLYVCDRKLPQTNNKDLLLLHSPVSGVTTPMNVAEMVVYPNPARDRVHVKTSWPEPIQFMLFDTTGRAVSRPVAVATTEGYQLTLPTNLAAGFYWLEARSGEKWVRKGVTIGPGSR